MKETNEVWIKKNDGWFTYYVNHKTGEKKLHLNSGEKTKNANQDDFQPFKNQTIGVM